jgi:hypothetical protein
LLRQDFHDIGRWTLLTIEVCHDFHSRVDVMEELFIGGAEVVESPFAVGGVSEAVLGAFAVAGKTNRAIATIFRKAVAFGLAKGLGHRAIGKRTEARVHEVAEFVFGVDVVIASVEIAIVLHREGATAGLGEIAESTANPEPFTEGYIKELYVNFADVAFDPEVEDFAKEVAVSGGRDGVF